MTALLITRPRAREGDDERIARGQERLFGDVGYATVPARDQPARDRPSELPERRSPARPHDSTAAPDSERPARRAPDHEDATKGSPAADRDAEHEPHDMTAAAALGTPAAATAIAGPTLDAAITSLWTSLTRSEPATCPVCSSPMVPRESASAGVVGGHCRSCGSTLG
jgi:hypothetical protein